MTQVFYESEPIISHLDVCKSSVDLFFNLMWEDFMKSGMSVVATDSQTGKVVGATTAYDAATVQNYGCCKLLNLIFCVAPFIPSELKPMVEIADEVVQTRLPEIIREMN